MDDIWESVFSAQSLDPLADTDGDGASNWDESEAGTDPFDPESSLELEELIEPDGTVELRWRGLVGKQYIVETSRDLANWAQTGARMGGTGAPMGVRIPVREEGAGVLLLQEWQVPGGANYDTMAELFTAGAPFSVPDRQDFISSLQFADTAPDKDYFYRQVRALVVPPATGAYRFHLSSGDIAELLVSGDADPANANVVAATTSYTAPNAFSQQADQISAAVPLVAGQASYLELRFYGRLGPDHIHLSWSGPGINLQAVPVAVLEPFEILPGEAGAFFRVTTSGSDADGDDVDDWSENQLGYNPSAAKSFSGVDDRAAILAELGGTQVPLHVASVRALPPFDSATGSGLASLAVAADGTGATVDFRFAHHTGNPVSMAIYLLPVGGGAPILVHDTPDTSFVGSLWSFGADEQAVLDALREGRLLFHVSSTGTNWQGVFESVRASRIFVPHPTPPPLPTGAPSRAEAVRFLNQATFGADEPSIARVRQIGYEAWIDEQLALPASLLVSEPLLSNGSSQPYEFLWWKHALTAPDQVRLRMAFALSEVIPVDALAVADMAPRSTFHPFYDIYTQHAFGNYRDLLDEMTRQPIMGKWLTYMGNTLANPVLGTRPDENYAREIMQLFSVGLVQRHPDGSVKLGRDGIPQATYGQDTVQNMARVFTGWSWSRQVGENSFFGEPDFALPMDVYPEYHDAGEKVILGGVVLPAGQTTEKDLSDTLDVLMAHPSTAPFLSRLLIQRFTNSNPGPGYIQRVASVFAATRGDLAAVTKAILLDHDARSAEVAALPGSGKVKEPIMRWTQVFRGLGLRVQPNAPASSEPPLFAFNGISFLKQAPLRSPTVFNFFSPDYQPPRITGQANLQDAGLVSPELQLLTESVAVTSLNQVLDTVLFGHASSVAIFELGLAYQSEPDDPLLALAVPGGNSGALVDHLDTLLLADTLQPATRSIIINAINHPNHQQSALERLKTAVYLMVASPEHAVLR